MVDALRADHLSCYGYYRNTSPNIDKFAEGGILFENYIVQGTWTPPSVQSIFTSKYPCFQMRPDEHAAFNKQDLVLAEILKNNGYFTIAHTGGGFLSPSSGFNRGFDILTENYASFSDNYEASLQWIKKNKNKKFFLLLHGYDIHTPYQHPEPFDRIYDSNYSGRISGGIKEHWAMMDEHMKKGYVNLSDRDLYRLISLYDGGINYFDNLTAQFLDNLSDLGLMNDTIIIITADHGEELLDHEGVDHGYSVYDEVIHVPLIIKIPGVNKKEVRVENQVRGIDLMPTILDVLDIKIIGKNFEGRSLIPLLEKDGKIGKMLAYSESFRGNSNKASIRSNEYKYILDLDTKEEELYNLLEDKKEKTNVINQTPPEIIMKYKEYLFKILKKKTTCLSKSGQEGRVSNETLERLKALGYIQ
jgi:arylsulfatase A-like enzyme